MSLFSVYALVDPLFPEDIRYIGYTSKSLTTRLRGHLNPSRADQERTHKNRWVRALINEGRKPTIILLETYKTRDEACKAEQRWIEKAFHEDWPLTNGTLGGDGGTPTKDVKAKQAETTRQQWQDPEKRERLLLPKMAAVQDPIFRQMQAENSKKQWQDPSQRELLRQRAKERWQNSSERQKQAERAKRTLQDPATREKHRRNTGEASRRSWQDPVVRQRRSEAIRKSLQLKRQLLQQSHNVASGEDSSS